MSPNKMLVHYLMSCYLYYKEDKQVLTDSQFDNLAKQLLVVWDDITHRHKDLISKDDLQAGTGYAIIYPTIIKEAAKQWLKESRRL